MGRWWIPDFYVDSVVDLTPHVLRTLKIKGLCIDVDCTLTDYICNQVPSDVMRWLNDILENGMSVCLVSNGGKRRIERIAKHLGVAYVSRALKPLPFGCLRAVRRLGLVPEDVAMVGDQIFADVLAGNWAGMKTVLVVPRGADHESFLTKWKRPIEKMILRRVNIPNVKQSAEEQAH